MDEPPAKDAPSEAGEAAPRSSSEALPTSLAPPDPASTSDLSSAPATDGVEPATAQAVPPKPILNGSDPSSPHFQGPQFSAQTESILKRINDNAANAAASGTLGWEAAREQVMRDMQTADKFPTPTPPRETGASQTGAQGATGPELSRPAATKMEIDTIQITPASSGRGRGGGRPRGRGRGGGRGGKRKRERSDDESDDSEVYSPAVTMTKSGRSVQKPSAFVPPPQSPATGNKRKRPYRKNPESAVCKVCLRGTSPANNMIVFCDGCNSPYHRYCHQPPIDQAVVDEVDKEWYCKPCEKERVAPVPESELANFISADGAPMEQRQRYFASLSPGMLVALLTRATTLKPDLPLFPPDFRARISSTTHPTTNPTPPTPAKPASNGHAHPPPSAPLSQFPTAPAPHVSTSGTYSEQYVTPDATHSHPQPQSQLNQQSVQQYSSHDYAPDVHPSNYPRPGQGLMRTLSSEHSQNLNWLVEEEDRYGVFSHMYQVGPDAAGAGMNVG